MSDDAKKRDIKLVEGSPESVFDASSSYAKPLRSRFRARSCRSTCG